MQKKGSQFQLGKETQQFFMQPDTPWDRNHFFPRDRVANAISIQIPQECKMEEMEELEAEEEEQTEDKEQNEEMEEKDQCGNIHPSTTAVSATKVSETESLVTSSL